MRNLIIIFISALLLISGCEKSGQDNQKSQDEAEIPTIVVTQWTDKMEIFMEWESPIISQPVKFIVHLTTLSDFQPVRDGKVILEFKDSTGQSISLEEKELLREGIFTPIITFDKSGVYYFTLSYLGNGISENFAIGELVVSPSIEEISYQEEEHGEEITFLKEQQWKTDFKTIPITQERVLKSVNSVGVVKPNPKYQAVIVSPAMGILSIEQSGVFAKPGQKVNKGQILGVLSPPADAKESWAKVYMDYKQSKSDFQRAQRLKNRGAISDQDFNRLNKDFKVHEAGIVGLLGNSADGYTYDTERHQFEFMSPLEGIISEVNGVPGQQIAAGSEVFTIVDPNNIWLKLDLYASQSSKIDNPYGITINIPGLDSLTHIKRDEFELISVGDVINKKTGTIPLHFEVSNPPESLKIGQRFSAKLYSTSEDQMLTVPRSAIYEENGKEIVFIHTSGESFEKRYVEVGSEFFEKVAIIRGVHSGERVVSRGGYQIKLASTSEEIGHPHTH